MAGKDVFHRLADLEVRLALHRNTLKRFCADGTFPHAVKVGRCWRVPESDVQTLVRRQSIPGN